MVLFLQVAQAVKNLETSTYWIHESAFAKRLGVTDADLEGWVKCVREGGSGAKFKNTFQPNPEPYNVKIDLADLSADNSLNLHYQEIRCNATPKVDGEVSLYSFARYYFVGASKSCLSTSLKTQIDIARYAVGVHNELLNNEEYKPIGERRRKLWRHWINGDREGDKYTKEDLPVIASVFADYFGVKWDRLRTSDLERVKWHIHEILAALNVLETTDNPLPRRSTRISNDSRDMEIDGIQSQRVLHQREIDTRQSNSSNDDSLDAMLGDNDDDDDEEMTHQAGYRALKNLLSGDGDDRIAGYRRAGVLEAAFKCAHGNGTIVDLNATLFALACPDLMSSNEFDRIAELPKRRLIRLLANFKQIKDEVMNKKQLFQISPDKLILEWLHDARRYSDGETFPQKIRDKQGHLKPEIAFMFRHIYFTNPRLGFKCLNDLFVSFFVMITGRSPTEDEFSSISTLRCHIAKLNAVDRYDQGQQYLERIKIKSPCGNQRFFGSCSDDTKHGGGGSALSTLRWIFWLSSPKWKTLFT